jgi:hypothetical protein
LLNILLLEQEEKNAKHFQDKEDPDIDSDQLCERALLAEITPEIIEWIHDQ